MTTTMKPTNGPKNATTMTRTDSLPHDLARLLRDSEQLLSEHDGRLSSLSGTDQALRDLLVQRVGAEQKGDAERVSAINSERESAAVRRTGLLHSLSQSSPQLRQLRVELEFELAGYARDVIALFSVRYHQALLTVEQLRAEGEAISKLLRVSVPMPEPVRITGEAHAPALDPSIPRIGGVLDRLGQAIEFTAGIVKWQAQVSEFAHSRLMESFDSTAVYRVSHGQLLTDPITGHSHMPGALLDALVLPAPLLARAFVSRSIVRSPNAR
jgi:hypothetical protein